MIKISKSNYTSFVTCPKQFWLNCHKSELAEETDEVMGLRFQQGKEAGEAALGLFSEIVNTKKVNEYGNLDIEPMCEKTKDLISADCPAIAEASFNHDSLFCAVDILKNNGDGSWNLYEVKSSTSRKPIYFYDIAFQKYVLTVCGVKISKCSLIYINNQYIRNGDINPNELFKIEEVSKDLSEIEKQIPEKLKQAQEVYAMEKEPEIDINENCNSAYSCAFYKYCSKHLPKNSVFNIYGLCKKKKFEYYNNGIISFDDIRRSCIPLNYKQQRQVDFELYKKPMFVDKLGIREFLGKIKYPMYFIDFETYQSCLPLYDGFKPYQQVPFQYSLHILRSKDDEKLEHREFLSDENINQWRELAEQLVKDIPQDNGSVISYNAVFETTRIQEMADAFPDLKKPLHDIIYRMIDLLDVFQSGYIYNKEMGGSFSIKNVLPALCPNNPNLDYKSLDVNNGMAATLAFLSLKNRTAEDREKIRKNLLLYCGLDSLAMAVIYKELCVQAQEVRCVK